MHTCIQNFGGKWKKPRGKSLTENGVRDFFLNNRIFIRFLKKQLNFSLRCAKFHTFPLLRTFLSQNYRSLACEHKITFKLPTRKPFYSESFWTRPTFRNRVFYGFQILLYRQFNKFALGYVKKVLFSLFQLLLLS